MSTYYFVRLRKANLPKVCFCFVVVVNKALFVLPCLSFDVSFFTREVEKHASSLLSNWSFSCSCQVDCFPSTGYRSSLVALFSETDVHYVATICAWLLDPDSEAVFFTVNPAISCVELWKPGHQAPCLPGNGAIACSEIGAVVRPSQRQLYCNVSVWKSKETAHTKKTQN